MSNNYVTYDMKKRLFDCMKSKDISTTKLCKALNVHYCDFKATMDGKSALYVKWQKRIADYLDIDRKELFKEFYV